MIPVYNFTQSKYTTPQANSNSVSPLEDPTARCCSWTTRQFREGDRSVVQSSSMYGHLVCKQRFTGVSSVCSIGSSKPMTTAVPSTYMTCQSKTNSVSLFKNCNMRRLFSPGQEMICYDTHQICETLHASFFNEIEVWSWKIIIFECFCLHFEVWNWWRFHRGHFKDLTTSYSKDWVGVFSGRNLKSLLFLMSLNALQSFTLNSLSGT